MNLIQKLVTSMILFLVVLLIMTACGGDNDSPTEEKVYDGPSNYEVEQAVWNHFEKDWGFNLQYTGLENVAVSYIGEPYKEGGLKYWPVKVNLTMDTLVFGKTTEEVKLVVVKDRWGDWIVD